MGSSAALAVVIVMVLAAGSVRARSGPVLRTVSVRTTIPHPAPTTATPAALSTTRPRTTTTTTVVKATVPEPKTRPTTTTTRPAPPPVPRRPPRPVCLALADMNHYTVVAANWAWLQKQLGVLSAHRLLAGPQYQALQLEEAQALVEIDAQYTIDKSNCYLR